VKLRTIAATAALVLLTLSGCATSDTLADQYAEGSGDGYISGDGSLTEIPVAERGEPIVFAGTDERGEPISSSDFVGSVSVVNFWYAACPPCRIEIPDLIALSEEYTDVPFVGVNIFDGADVAISFATKFGVPYPSILDADTASVQLAFAGVIAPNAVPTTLVLDREGRVAARISGIVREQSILAAMIDSVVAEK
jgi:thiol-disulfide isomerase/thioredoxin